MDLLQLVIVNFMGAYELQNPTVQLRYSTTSPPISFMVSYSARISVSDHNWVDASLPKFGDPFMANYSKVL